MRRTTRASWLLASALGLLACDDGTVTTTGTSSGGSGGAGTVTAAQSTTGQFATNGSTTTGGDVCMGTGCPADQHCEDVNGVGTCVNNTCADLMCGPKEICETTPGGGAVCTDISCAADVDCAADQFCDPAMGVCVDDVCTAGARHCVGAELFECASNGGADAAKYTCGSPTAFGSTCVDAGNGVATCTCEDDWDCPAFTTCEAGACSGTGKAPTCTLPPVSFANALPVNEIQWGGTGSGANSNAVNAPFPLSAQACATPIVANLDDDNGDGLIDERDFAEIVFMTYCGSDVATNGIIRAIHGGGPNKGKDYFAQCGATVWHEGDPLNMACACASAEGNSTAAVAVGDLDGDGVPEIIVPNENDALVILDNHGNAITRSANNQWPLGYVNPAPTIANLDQQGFAEIVVGNNVFTLAHDAMGKLVFVDRFSGGALPSGQNGQGPVPCVANISGGPTLEIVAGTTAYALPTPPPGVVKRADCAVGATDDFCTGKLTVVWDGQAKNPGLIAAAQRDGFCAIADVLGADETIAPGPTNPLDGTPEVIVIAEGYLLILNGQNGTLRRSTNLNAGLDGGAPNVDDFDGDGFPEIGTAFGTSYLHIDLQDTSPACPAWPTPFVDGAAQPATDPARAPGGACAADTDCAAGAVCNPKLGACVCLHNGWKRTTEDDSSRVTSSSVFDFNGDGAAEVVYNDECYFRIYDGRDGTPLFKQHSPSRTRIENPAIADVDNDGNAEIVFPSNNDTSSCSAGANYPNGIAVWGDASDAWVSARRVWNQHSYHVTNVTESAAIPLHEPEHWKDYNGRTYDTYRSNPRAYDVAPDLAIGGVQITSPDATCGQLSTNLSITVEVRNEGDLRVGPGVALTFYGHWATGAVDEPLYADAAQTPLTIVLAQSLEPGTSVLVSVPYDALTSTPMSVPDTIAVVVDEANVARECDELDNQVTVPVDPGLQQADLRIELGAASASCPAPTIATTIFNDGSAPASNILVRYYAGDPSQGGSLLGEVVVPGPLAAGANTTLMTSLPGFPASLDILVYGVVDPLDAIPECNDGNNKDAADNKVICTPN
ncbi:MAG: hypothetical protein U0414_40095 [Polyangiaceae bacterium]